MSKLSDGSSCIVVKFENDKEYDLLLNYLHDNNYKGELKGPIGMDQYSCNWYWININNHIYCIGKPGVAYTQPLGNHAVSVDEFITINDIYKKYDGLEVLKMN